MDESMERSLLRAKDELIEMAMKLLAKANIIQNALRRRNEMVDEFHELTVSDLDSEIDEEEYGAGEALSDLNGITDDLNDITLSDTSSAETIEIEESSEDISNSDLSSDDDNDNDCKLLVSLRSTNTSSFSDLSDFWANFTTLVK